MKALLKLIARRLLPPSWKRRIKIALNTTQSYLQLKRLELAQERMVKKFSRLEKIRVGFFLFSDAIWKYDLLFQLLQKSDRFEPTIYIVPLNHESPQEQKKTMGRALHTFQLKGYSVVNCALPQGGWIDVADQYKPEIVFFSTPWSITLPQYSIMHFVERALTCYVPYGYTTVKLYQGQYNMPMQNLCWKFFLETPLHLQLAQQYSSRKGRNAVVTGTPGVDALLLPPSTDAPLVWKKQTTPHKRIIWAPHHTIPGVHRDLTFSTFLDIADQMVELTDRYRGRVQFAFKPHPHLREKLSRPDIWGVEKTDAYYNTWATLPNAQLEEGMYVDLFQQSDALIHDSGAFAIEYLYTKKPILYLVSHSSVIDELNPFGRDAFNLPYLGENFESVVNFIERQVIRGEDPLYEARNHFFESRVCPPNQQTASQNIYDYLCSKLSKK